MNRIYLAGIACVLAALVEGLAFLPLVVRASLNGAGRRRGKRCMKKNTTSTFLLELPLSVDAGQARRLRAHFEAARCLYNALLGEAMKRLHRMHADTRWQAARRIQATEAETGAARRLLCNTAGVWLFGVCPAQLCLRRCAMPGLPTISTRSWRKRWRPVLTGPPIACASVRRRRCVSGARGAGWTVLRTSAATWDCASCCNGPEEGNGGWLLWGKDRLAALIDWHDPVVKHGLDHRIKYARLVRRKASSPSAQGADAQGYRYYVQLVLEGKPYQKPKHTAGT